eukprot:NODE_346_length_10492_cov_0.275955.p2 type:complete len:414 gc:universal NODE_346_length_10492_cov_0.275955:2131-3372(+)
MSPCFSMHDDEISMTVEQTNVMRAKLGLKLLKVEAQPVLKQEIQKIEEPKFDTDEWLSKMARKSAEQNTKTPIKEDPPEDIHIGHNFDDINYGHHVFTLKDSQVADEPVLENTMIRDINLAQNNSFMAQSNYKYDGKMAMEHNKPLLYQYKTEEKGFKLNSPNPKKRKLQDYLGEKVSLSVNQQPAEETFTKIKKFKNIKKVKRSIRKALEEEVAFVDSVASTAVVKPSIEGVINAARAGIDAVDLPLAEIPEVEIEDDNERLKSKPTGIKPSYDTNSMDTGSDVETNDKSINNNIQRRYNNDAPNTNFLDLPVFAVSPFLPKIVQFVDVHAINMKIKELDAKIQQQNTLISGTNNRIELIRLERELKKLGDLRFSLIQDKMKSYAPSISFEGEKNEKMTKKKATIAINAKKK